MAAVVSLFQMSLTFPRCWNKAPAGVVLSFESLFPSVVLAKPSSLCKCPVGPRIFLCRYSLGPRVTSVQSSLRSPSFGKRFWMPTSPPTSKSRMYRCSSRKCTLPRRVPQIISFLQYKFRMEACFARQVRYRIVQERFLGRSLFPAA